MFQIVQVLQSSCLIFPVIHLFETMSGKPVGDGKPIQHEVNFSHICFNDFHLFETMSGKPVGDGKPIQHEVNFSHICFNDFQNEML